MALENAPSGPGTELRDVLRNGLLIWAAPDAEADEQLGQMDEWGPDLCEQNLPTIVGWLRAHAADKAVPFETLCAERAVKLACSRAREKAAR